MNTTRRYWTVILSYKNYVYTEEFCSQGDTEAAARRWCEYYKPPEVGWRIVSIKPH